MDMSEASLRPLSGIRVVEVAQFLAGPYAALLLAQLGADVIKIERPRVGDAYRHAGPPFVGELSAPFIAANRGKRSVTLDLTDSTGREIAALLCAHADVVIVSGRPETAEKLGLDYDTVREGSTSVVYCSITGYGHEGPKAHLGATDLIVQGASGLMSVTGDPEGEPVRFGVPITDYGTGMYAALAILAALRVRDRTGAGTFIDANLFSTATSWGVIPLIESQLTGTSQDRTGNVHPHIAPYQVVRTSNGLMAIAAPSDAAWRKLCEALDSPELVDDPRFQSNQERRSNIRELRAELEKRFAPSPTEEWIKLLTEAGIACGPVQGYEAILSDPEWCEHLRLDECEQDGTPIEVPGLPVAIKGWTAHSPGAPRLGEHTEEVLQELGLEGYEPSARE